MKRFIEDVKKYRKYAVYAAKSELKSEVANSHLSWLWWILDPLLFMLVYSFVAVIVFRKSEQYFAAFIFIGYNCWNFFSNTLRQSVKLVTANSAIVSKVYLPKFVLIFVKMTANGFKMMIAFSIVVVMMVGYHVPVDWKILYMLPLFLTLFVVTFGLSTFLLHFGVYVEDLANVIQVVLKLIFYLTGIFYSVSKRVPYPYSSMLLKCNPMAYLIDAMRDSLLYQAVPDCGLMAAWFLVGLLLSVFGVRTIYRHENSYVKVM